ncbi:hypothetical protein [Escherichia coli]|uniref:hypothetical protein n=1 Tax=Escherichia coli TaxID=562 RepID=UPI00200BBDD3|nr:hypothetical protein [Escherichia coli]
MKLIFQHGDGRLLPAGDVVRPVQRGAQAGVLCSPETAPPPPAITTHQHNHQL